MNSKTYTKYFIVWCSIIVLSYFAKIFLYNRIFFVLSADMGIALLCDLVALILLYTANPKSLSRCILSSLSLGWVYFFHYDTWFILIFSFSLYLFLSSICFTKKKVVISFSILFTIMQYFIGTSIIQLTVTFLLYRYYQKTLIKQQLRSYLVPLTVCLILGTYLLYYDITGQITVDNVFINTTFYSLFLTNILFLAHLFVTNYGKVKLKLAQYSIEHALFFYILSAFLLGFIIINRFAIDYYIPIFTLLFLLVIIVIGIAYGYFSYQLRVSATLVQSLMYPWLIKQLLAIHEDKDEHYFFIGVDEPIQKWVNNDGICILYNDVPIYQTGIFREALPKIHFTFKLSQKFSIKFHQRYDHRDFRIIDFIKIRHWIQYMNPMLEIMIALRDTLPATTLQSMQSYTQQVELRKNISYYLHDNILQDLLASRNILQLLQTNDVAMKDLLFNTLSDMSTSIRNQMHEIYPSSLNDLNFEQNIAILIDRIYKSQVNAPIIHVDYQFDSEPKEMIRFFLYQSALELITNACKHADATYIQIFFYEDNHQFVMKVEDNGTPFKENPLALKNYKHIGLHRIYREASQLNGTFVISSQKDKKSFIIKLPKEPPNENNTF